MWIFVVITIWLSLWVWVGNQHDGSTSDTEAHICTNSNGDDVQCP